MSSENYKDIFDEHLDKLLTKNKPYFDHIRGTCLCGICACGQCHCDRSNLNLDYKKGGESLYQSDFLKFNSRGAPLVKNDFWRGFDNPQPIDLSTTNRTDYKTQPLLQDLKAKGRESQIKGYIPFASVSSYKNNFLNWGSNAASNIKPPYHPTVIKDMPFVGKTLYRDSFKGKPADVDKEGDKLLNNARYAFFSNPLCPDIPFIGETTNNNTFRPFKTERVKMENEKKLNDSIPTYMNQYKTIHKKDYDENRKGKVCPAKIERDRRSNLESSLK